MHFRPIFILAAIATLNVTPVRSSPVDTLFDKYIYSTFNFLPDYRMDADLQTFFFHKNAYMKERLYLEANTNIEFVLVSFKDLISSVWKFEFQTGMGQTPGNVVFDPMDINYGIVPTIEYKTPYALFQAGLEHHCFHEIDRTDLATIYWNKLYVASGSLNYRFYDQWSRLVDEANWSQKDRISWYFRYGYFVKEFFGIIDSNKINGNNDYDQEGWANVRYTVFRRHSWIVNATGLTKIGLYGGAAHHVYWRQDFGAESEFRRGKRGIMLFANYTLDDLPLNQGVPRFSKDRLLQVGVRFFY
jgi:hypothetical protein